MAKGFFFDMTSCIGCKTCQVACKDKNDLPAGIIYRTVYSFEVGAYPAVDAFHISMSCNHCANPACVENCPTGAMYKDEETGLVLHKDDLCIGCETCAKSCPYSVPKLLPAKNISGKCDSCIMLRNKGEKPACVAACPMRALDFGEIDELQAKYGAGTMAIPCLPAPATNPTTNFMVKEIAKKSGAKEIVY